MKDIIGYFAGSLFLAFVVIAPTIVQADGKLTGEDRRKRLEAGKCVEVIAAALKSYAGDHDGKLPKRLRSLVPKYLKSASALELPHHSTSLPKGIPVYLVWMHGAGIEDPDDENQSMISFSPSEFPGGGRYIIDARFQVWFCGEGRFQDWIHGRKFDEGAVEDGEVLFRPSELDAEQAGGRQSASESKSEGNDKPERESEGRSQ